MPRTQLNYLFSEVAGKTADTILARGNRSRKNSQDFYPVRSARVSTREVLRRMTRQALAFQWVDSLYTEKPESEKIVWREAVKRSALSGYGLWMKEALTLVMRGLNPPDTPSDSGGFSTLYVKPGVNNPLLPCLTIPPTWENPPGRICSRYLILTPKYQTIYVDHPRPAWWPIPDYYTLPDNTPSACFWRSPQPPAHNWWLYVTATGMYLELTWPWPGGWYIRYEYLTSAKFDSDLTYTLLFAAAIGPPFGTWPPDVCVRPGRPV
jgi:hypothetical protein